MKICIIQIGKTKDKYLAECLVEFVKRLWPYVKFEIVTLKEIVAGKTFTTDACFCNWWSLWSGG